MLPAYTNHGPACACPHADRSPARHSLWMPLPHLASPYKGEETEWPSPYKGEETEWRPHKSLKGQNKKTGQGMIPWPVARVP